MKSNIEIKSLNSALPEFYVDRIECRLETDSLTLGGLMDLSEIEKEEFCYWDGGCDCNNVGGECINKGPCYINI